jgi:PKD repeat protein
MILLGGDLDDSDPDTWPNFIHENDVKSDWPEFVYMEVDKNFNENFSHPIIQKYGNPLGYANMFFPLFELMIQMRLWKITHPTCVGVLKYNFDHTTYNMQICTQLRLPVINIIGDDGNDIIPESPQYDEPLSAHITRFWINQSYNTSAESYNVIGKIIGTDSGHEILVDCLYDSWWNRGAADSAVGVGLVLAIAKFFDDTGITPKHTINFVLFSGEEFAKNGAADYYKKHHQYLRTMIDLNQLGFSQTGSLPQTFFVVNNHPYKPFHNNIHRITELIVNEANYPTRSNTPNLRFLELFDGGPSDTTEFAHDPLLDTILFVKDINWTLHHRDGEEHTRGDTMEYYDEKDCSLTAEMIWNVTKYFTMWPECSFTENPTYITEDSTNDDDTHHDTVKATIAMESILPQDRVRVKASLTKRWSVLPIVTEVEDFTITDTSANYQISVTLPPYADHGNYHLTLELLNSTARINDIVYQIGLPNDIDVLWNIELYPRGNEAPQTPVVYGDTLLHIGQIGSWWAPTSDANGDLIGEKWYMNSEHSQNSKDTGLYDGITPLMDYSYMEIGTYKIKVRAYDQFSSDIHPYMSDYSEEHDVHVTPWSDIIPQQQIHPDGDLHLITTEENLFLGCQVGCQGLPDYAWEFSDERGATHAQNTSHPQFEEGEYIAYLNVTDPTTQLTGSSHINIRVTPLDADFRLNYYHGTSPNTTIQFYNTSRAAEGITSITWDFGDGNTSNESNPTHAYDQDGDYNVTLTLTDNNENVDVDYFIIHVKAAPDLPAVPYNQNPGIVLSGNNATILAEVTPTDRNITNITLSITNPDGTFLNTTMTRFVEDNYFYTYENPTQSGNYTYTITVRDIENLTNCSTGSFTLLQPYITFEEPTPDTNAILNQNWVTVNTSILDPHPTAAFIDWNHSLKGYWSMDLYNDTYLYDISPYQNVGNYNGINASNITAGTYGKGLNFDANGSYIDLGNDTSLNLDTGDFTFTTWIKSQATSYPGTAVILSNQPETTAWNGYILGVTNTPYIATMENGINTTLTGTVDVTDNIWHHITYIRQGGTLKLYVDGIPDGIVTGSTQDITNDQTTCLDRKSSTSLYQFNGVLDEAILFNRALTRDEINTTINSTALPPNHIYTGLDDGTYTFAAYAIDTTGNQSTTETRQVTIDTHAPTITGVTATPSTVGLGYNVTFQATVTDATSGVNTVKAIITGPNYGDQLHLNETMTKTGENTYQYVFTNSNKVGTYTYSIYSIDNATNSIIQTGYTFTISANASISVSTLKDTYTNTNDFINLTDPPEIPENYTLISQGLTWNNYAAPDGDHNILETSTVPINYQNQTGEWNPINNTIQTLGTAHPAYAYGYRVGNERGIYSTYFKPNLQDTWPVVFAYNKSQDPTLAVVRTKLVGVGYLDPTSNWNYHILQNTQNSQGQLTGNIITYPGAFTGTDLIMGYGSQELKEVLVMSNATKAVLQSHPPSLYGLSNDHSYLVFITKVDAQNLALYNTTEQITGDTTITGTGIDFKTALEEFKCAMPLGEAYELNNESIRQTLTYRIVHYNGDVYILAGLRLTDLQAMTYPVVIDPSITLYTSSDDGDIYHSNTNYNTVWGSARGTVDNTGTSIFIGQRKQPGMPTSTYYIYRGFLFFDTSQIPSNAIIDTATLGLYKASDYSSTDFDITVQNGQPTYPARPMKDIDYDKSHYSGNGGTFGTSGFTSGYNNLVLNSDGRSWINRTGWTKLCLRSSRDISGTTPTGNEYVTIDSNEFLGVGCQPRLVIAYRNQSKIKNTGTTNIKGYLMMQVQYHTVSGWVLDTEVINETSPRTILASNQLGLDTVFNGLVHISVLTHGSGTYRIYAAFRDPNGNVLMIDATHKLEATWQFTVSISG